MVTHLLINWTLILLTEWIGKDSRFKSVLCSLPLTYSIVRTSCDQWSLSIISIGKAKTVQIILFENCLKVCLVRFLFTAYYLSLLCIRWNIFSGGLRSRERAGILNRLNPYFSIVSLNILQFYEGLPSSKTAYLFYCFLL